ncbi:MAG: efflux RND transporter periplasmic adaptor subunit [Bacteroidetes bacterium]|nr:efflux RND transporter periplasmic adaptor subunit [Bacteroidota bacterium]
MNKRILIIIAAIVTVSAASYLLFFNNGSSNNNFDEKQLYTCGMHPEIISDEPGNCPICEMKLTPIKINNKSSGEKKILYWRAPMDPNEIYDKPGKSKMGMELVPVYDDEGSSSGVVTIDASIQQNMNLKLTTVEEKKLSNVINTNGVLTTDERNEFIVTTKVNGWIEKLYVNYTGQKIKKGEKLADIYSPELVAAQQELLTAVEYKNATTGKEGNNILNSGDELINNTIKKLELLDISDADIKNIIETKKLRKYVTLYAPANGTVLMKYVIEGEKIAAGKQLLHIADLSNLWLKADIYENELNKVSIGSKAKINFTYFPAKTYEGKVSFIYPTINPKTRIIQVRINISNNSNELKPDMFAKVEIIGNDLGLMPVISETSVIRSGQKNISILSLGQGKFKPVEIKLGGYSDGYYQILSGLKTGDKIVSSAQFLIDSESSLRSAINMYNSVNYENPENKNSISEENKNEKISNTKESEHKHAQTEIGSVIVREGIIDVESIDINNDGKVFECPMDWNVISDESGNCPLCEMKLLEYSVEETKENLTNNGFKHK